jgi:hypothetical protein
MMNFMSSSIPNILSLSIKIMACTKVFDRFETNGILTTIFMIVNISSRFCYCRNGRSTCLTREGLFALPANRS